jgi:hypothetical protein
MVTTVEWGSVVEGAGVPMAPGSGEDDDRVRRLEAGLKVVSAWRRYSGGGEGQNGEGSRGFKGALGAESGSWGVGRVGTWGGGRGVRA